MHTSGTNAGPTSGELSQRPAVESSTLASLPSGLVIRASSNGWPHISGTGTSNSSVSDWLTHTQYTERAKWPGAPQLTSTSSTSPNPKDAVRSRGQGARASAVTRRSWRR